MTGVTTWMASVRGRRAPFVAFYAVVVSSGAILLLAQVGSLGVAFADPKFWVMAALAMVAGTQAFMATVGERDVAAVVTPTVAFGFAILITWGAGPAIVAQAASVSVTAWHLRRSVPDAVLAAARYAVALSAASVVLWWGNPDPFGAVASPSHFVLDAVLVVVAGLIWLVMYGLLIYVGDRLALGAASLRTVGAVREQVLLKSSLLVLSPVLAFAAEINVLFLPLVLIPLYAVHRMARLSAERDRAARTDPLTGLDNRAGLRAAFGHVDPAAVGPPVSLLVLDLDRFKQVNDALGHDVGDRLLVTVADRLPRGGGDVVAVARLGGDEFAVLAAVSDPRVVADDIVKAVGEPVILDGLRVDVTASIGIAVREPDDDFLALMRRADIAMYEAKHNGDPIAVYRAQSDRTSSQQLALLADLRAALEEDRPDEIAVHYQPQVRLVDDRVEGVEALIRWRHPEHGPVPAATVLALVEHTPVMSLLTTRVVEHAVRQAAQWKRAGFPLRVSVNVSARDLYSDDVLDRLIGELHRHRVDPSQFQIELTESALLADLRRAQDPLRRLADCGISISLDDFGTGYSSLQHLRRLPIDEIKIDQSFVAGMADNPDDAAIVRSTVDLAKSLQIRTVAEGVEDAVTWRLCAATGCDLAQGWHADPPMPGPEITRRLLDGPSTPGPA